MWICSVICISLLFIVTAQRNYYLGTANTTVLDCLVKLNNRAIRNVCNILIKEEIPIKDVYLFTYIVEIKNIFK